MTKNKLQRIAKNKLQIGKFVKNGSSSKSVTFLLFCRNLPGKANLKRVKVVCSGTGLMLTRQIRRRTKSLCRSRAFALLLRT